MSSSFEYPPPRLQPVWIRVVVALGLYLFGSGILSGGLVALSYFPRFIPEGDPSTWEGMDLNQEVIEGILQEPLAQWLLLFGSALGALLVVFLMRKFVDRRPLLSLGWPRGVPMAPGLAWGVLYGGLLAGVSVLLIAAVGQRHVRWEAFDGTWGWGLAFLAVICFIAVCEEWFFRGYVFVNLREEGGRGPAILWSALFFAGLHMGNPSAGFLGMMNVFLLGGILGILRDMTGSMAAGVGFHAAWNVMLGVILGSGVSGFELPSLFRLNLEGVSPLLGGGGFGPEASLVVTILLLMVGGWLVVRYLKFLSIKPGGDRDSD